MLQKFLTKKGIESRPIISGNLLRQPFLINTHEPKDYPNAEFMHNNAFYIGNNQFVGPKRLKLLEDLLEEFFETLKKRTKPKELDMIDINEEPC